MLMIWCCVVLVWSYVCGFVRVSQEWGFYIRYDVEKKCFGVLYDDGMSWDVLEVGNLRFEMSFWKNFVGSIGWQCGSINWSHEDLIISGNSICQSIDSLMLIDWHAKFSQILTFREGLNFLTPHVNRLNG